MMRAVKVAFRVALLGALLGAVVLNVERGSAVLPGENGKIAFASARNGNFEIYAVSPDATGLTRLTADPGTDSDPAWSADGTRIAFQSTRDQNDEIYLMGADGSGQTRLTTSPGNDQNATWSPGGRSLAFLSTRDGDSEIFVMNEDGTGQSQLTTNTVADATPAWSPDGSKIAFRSERDGNSEIYVMNVDGTLATRLTTSASADVSPCWSPDGRMIAFATDRDGNYEIYLMNADGSGQSRLTRNLDTDLDPAWSPDGRYIAFTTNRDGNNEIYVMNADGSAPTRITTSAFEDTTPDWQWQRTVPPAPQPLTDARAVARWKESRLRGTLVIRGVVPGLARIQLALRRGQRVYLARGLVLSQGTFTRKLALPRDLLPGPYVLAVTAVGSPTALSAQTLPVEVRTPAEGVVSEAWASAKVGGPPMDRVPATNGIVWAHFRFAALPRAGRVLTTQWYVNGKPPPSGPKVKRPRGLVVAFAVPGAEGEPLPRGRYECVLRAGRIVVKRVSVRVL
jgi:Tol biopolymer transport system component